MATRMLQRRGTAAEWAAANPVLADGEIGFERDTRIIKIGDGVTPWSALQLPYLTPAVVDAKGDLIVGVADNTVAKLARGTTGQRLTVQAEGSLAWETPPAIPASISPTIIDAKGDLVVGTANDTPARLAAGTVGQRLTVQADGSIAWETPAVVPASISPNIIDAKGDLIVGTADNTPARLASTGGTGNMLIADSTKAAGMGWDNTVRPIGASSAAMILKGLAGQANDMLMVLDSNNLLLANVDKDGNFSAQDLRINGTSIGSAWTTYAPTFANVTGGVVIARYKLVGKSMKIRISFSGGTATGAGTVSVTLPPAVTALAGGGIQLVAGNGVAGSWTVLAGSNTLTSSGALGAGAGLAGLVAQGDLEVS